MALCVRVRAHALRMYATTYLNAALLRVQGRDFLLQPHDFLLLPRGLLKVAAKVEEWVSALGRVDPYT